MKYRILVNGLQIGLSENASTLFKYILQCIMIKKYLGFFVVNKEL